MDATFEQWVKKLEAVDQTKLVQRMKNWNNGLKKNWRCGFKNCKNVFFFIITYRNPTNIVFLVIRTDQPKSTKKSKLNKLSH
jgi:hypothetical protein